MGFKKRLKIGGEYWYYSSLSLYSSKTDAKKHASMIRKGGTRARVVKVGNMWAACKR